MMTAIIAAVATNGNASTTLLVATMGISFLGTIVTLVVAWFKEARDRKWKLEDEARQKELVKKTEELTKKTEATQEQVVKIHELSNSAATAGAQERLLALQGQVVLMQRMIILNKEQGIETTKSDSDLLVAMRAKVDDLQSSLNLRQQPEPTGKPEQTGEAVKVGDLEVSIDQLQQEIVTKSGK